jgi:site-specific DNA-methyltransferase (adenine-specific)
MVDPVQIGNATLYQGDCIEIMPTLGIVNHVITDPPYEKEAHNPNRRIQRREGMVAGALEFGQITEATRANIAFGCANHCDGWFIAFCQAEGVAPWRDSIEAAGAKYKSPMIWVKPDGMPKFNGQGPGMGYESMVSAWCGNGVAKWNGGGRHGVFTFPKGEGILAQHQTQKPIRLMAQLVRLFSNQGHTILDPFMGSGTTGVACAKLGRKFIGIESEPKYFDIACERIQKAYDQPDLFIEQPKKATQEKMEL